MSGEGTVIPGKVAFPPKCENRGANLGSSLCFGGVLEREAVSGSGETRGGAGGSPPPRLAAACVARGDRWLDGGPLGLRGCWGFFYPPVAVTLTEI